MEKFDLLGLPGIFQTISDAEQTGTLKIKKDQTSRYIIFTKGKVNLVIVSDEISIIVYGLNNYPLIDNESLEYIFEKQRETNKTLINILREVNIDNKYLDNEQFILEICQNQIREEIYELFRWSNVSCEFAENHIPKDIVDRELLDLPISLNPQALVMEAAKRQDEWDVIGKHIPSDRDIPYFIYKNSVVIAQDFDMEDFKQQIFEKLQNIENFQELLIKAEKTPEEIFSILAYLSNGEIKLKEKIIRKVLEILEILSNYKELQYILEKLLNFNELVYIILNLIQEEKLELKSGHIKCLLNIISVINGINDFEEIFDKVHLPCFRTMKICSGLVLIKKIKIKNVEELMRMAKLDIITRDTSKNIKIYERIEEISSKDLQITEWLAKAYKNCGLTNKSIEKYHELGLLAIDDELYDIAINAFKEIIKSAPEDLAAYERLINAYNKNGEREMAAEISAIYARRVSLFDKRKAIMVLDEANKNYPSSPSNLELMASLYLEMGNAKNAMLTYEILANLMKKNDNLQKALEAYNKILNIEPGYIKAQLELAKGYIDLNNIKEGIAQYKKLGELLFKKFKSEESENNILTEMLINVCECIICYEPNNINAREWLADTYIAMQDKKTALNILREILGLLHKKDNIDKLVTNLKKVVAMDFDDFRSRKRLADILLGQDKKNEAINEYMHLGIKCFEKYDMRRAKEAFDAVIKIDPYNLTARQKRAEILSQLNLHAKAVQEYKLIGHLAQAVGMLPEAIQSFTKISELESDKELWSFLEIAQIAEKLKEKEKAIKYYILYAEKNMTHLNYGRAYKACSQILFLDAENKKAIAIKQKSQEQLQKLRQIYKSDESDEDQE